MRANEFLTEERLDEGWKGALAAVGFMAAALAGTIIGTEQAEKNSVNPPVTHRQSEFQFGKNVDNTTATDTSVDNKKTIYGDDYYEKVTRPMIIKSVLDMATIVHSAHNMGMTRSQAISMLTQGGASGEVLKVGSAIATLEYSVPKGYWTSEEFKGIVYREIIQTIPKHD